MTVTVLPPVSKPSDHGNRSSEQEPQLSSFAGMATPASFSTVERRPSISHRTSGMPKMMR